MTDCDYQDAAERLRDADELVLTAHINPDGDGIGSCLALYHGLRGLGKSVRVLMPGPISRLYSFLPGAEAMHSVADSAAAKALPPTALLVSCDCGDLKRLDCLADLPHEHLLNCDHHASNDRFGDSDLVDIGAACTGMVVERLLTLLGVHITPEIAACLYCTVVYDTGRFMHSNTTAEVFRWSAMLLDTGIDAAAINRHLTYTRSLNDLALTRLGIEQLQVDVVDPRLAGIALNAEHIASVGKPEDWGDLVEIPRSLAGNHIAYLVREQPDKQSCRVSLRSNPPWAVGPVASRFGGGGHAQAAGCTVPGDLASVLAQLQPALRAVMQVN